MLARKKWGSQLFLCVSKAFLLSCFGFDIDSLDGGEENKTTICFAPGIRSRCERGNEKRGSRRCRLLGLHCQSAQVYCLHGLVGWVLLACFFTNLLPRIEYLGERSACIKFVDQFDFDELYGKVSYVYT